LRIRRRKGGAGKKKWWMDGLRQQRRLADERLGEDEGAGTVEALLKKKEQK
jgi:hypothetical protein